jgi:hypothetical protein
MHSSKGALPPVICLLSCITDMQRKKTDLYKNVRAHPETEDNPPLCQEGILWTKGTLQIHCKIPAKVI